MSNMKRNKADEGLKESPNELDPIDIFHTAIGSVLTFPELDADLKNYEMYKSGLHDCECLYGMIDKLEIIKDVRQENASPSIFRCPLCLQAFPELFQLNSHECITDDLELCQDRHSSSSASTALTSTRKDIGELLKGKPKMKLLHIFTLFFI